MEMKQLKQAVLSFLRQLTAWHCPISCCAPCCVAAVSERRTCSNRSMSHARLRAASGLIVSYRYDCRVYSSKAASATCGGRMMARTDGRTDGRTDARLFHKRCSAYFASNADTRAVYYNYVTSFLEDNLRRNGSVLVLRCDSGQTTECRRRDEWEEVTETVLRRMANLFKEFLLETRCKAKPDCSPPGYPFNRLLIIVNVFLNWFACVHRVR